MSSVDTDPLEALSRVEPFTRLEPATLAGLRPEVAWRSLTEGHVLVEEGADAHGISVVIEGRLGVVLAASNGSRTTVAELGPGSIVGEIAFLLARHRTAAVVAVTASTIVDLTAAGFDAVLSAAPDIGIELTQRAAARLRVTQLVGHLTRLFGDLPRPVLDGVLRSVEDVHLPAGQMLFGEGEPADAAYLVLSGRLRILRGPEGATVADVGAGELVGELALLDGDERGATVVAVRDTALARLPRDAFDRLVTEHPSAMLAITRRLIVRTREPFRARRDLDQPLSIALVPHSADVDLRLFTSQLVGALGTGAFPVWSARADSLLHRPGLAQSEPGTADDLRLTHWLHETEQRHRFVVYETDRTWTPWSERACRQADEVLIVARASTADRSLGVLEEPLARDRTAQAPRRTLVLLHEPTTGRPSDTARWLDAREVGRHLHVRDNHRGDVARLARTLAGTATGLVCSGGGARGLAHLGVLRALREAGLAIDMYGGSSIGAIMAFGATLEWPDDELVPRVSDIFSGLLDYTLPMVSLLKGARITRAISEVADGRDIEDLWTDFFCISTNLTRQTEVVHRRGDLAHALRASVAIPGVLPPVPMGDDLLIDGGSMNNLPVDRMREANPSGTVIAVDVAPPRGPGARSDTTPVISGWGQMAGRVVPGRRPVRTPSIFITLLGSTVVSAMRDRHDHVRDGLADLYLDLDLRGHGLLDFDDATAIARAGYDAAKPRVDAWLRGRTGDDHAAADAP